MKMKYDGHVLDEEKAINIVELEGGGGCQSGDLHGWIAILCRTPRSGHFFLSGRGGAGTRFARQCEDGAYMYGEKIIPLSERDAFYWLEAQQGRQVANAAWAALPPVRKRKNTRI